MRGTRADEKGANVRRGSWFRGFGNFEYLHMLKR